MGLLDQIMGGMTAGNFGQPQHQPRGGAGSMVVNGLLIALAAKAAQHYMGQRAQARSFDPRTQQQQQSGGLGGGLGGLAGMAGMAGGPGGGLASVLGGLGGAGAIGALLNQLRSQGLGDQVDSWVSRGPNTPIPPHQLAGGLGEDTIAALSRQTGMPRSDLLAELSQALPAAVDDLTPEGREPSDLDLERALGRH